LHLYGDICLTTKENHRKISLKAIEKRSADIAERDSYSRFGHQQAMGTIGLLAPTVLGFSIKRQGQTSIRISDVLPN
jgi:hypothetical protein